MGEGEVIIDAGTVPKLQAMVTTWLSRFDYHQEHSRHGYNWVRCFIFVLFENREIRRLSTSAVWQDG